MVEGLQLPPGDSVLIDYLGQVYAHMSRSQCCGQCQWGHVEDGPGVLCSDFVLPLRGLIYRTLYAASGLQGLQSVGIM